MKNKASRIVKNIMSVVSSLKGKVSVVKSKADSLRIRLLVFSLIKSKKLSVDAISSKIQGFLDKKRNNQVKAEEDLNEEDILDQNKAIVLYNSNTGSESHLNCKNISDDLAASEKRELLLEYYGHDENYCNNDDDDDDDGKYPDLTHSMFDEEVDNNHGGSVINMVKNTKENEGKDFKLEDEIDHVADLFIKKFRRQMLLQKWDSFKKLQEMLGRSA